MHISSILADWTDTISFKRATKIINIPRTKSIKNATDLCTKCCEKLLQNKKLPSFEQTMTIPYHTAPHRTALYQHHITTASIRPQSSSTMIWLGNLSNSHHKTHSTEN